MSNANDDEDELLFEYEAPAKRGACSLAAALNNLQRDGALEFFGEFHGQEQGDCHTITCSIMTDLYESGAYDGWRWCRGFGYFNEDPSYHEFEHSWVEYDGWALEASNGQLVIRDAQTWRSRCKARDVVERDAEQTVRWALAQAKRQREEEGR